MSDTENVLPDVSPPAPPSKKPPINDNYLQNALLAAPFIQIALAMLLYMAASINPLFLIIEGVIAVGMALFSHYAMENRIARVFIRVLSLFFALCLVLPSIVLLAYSYGTADTINDTGTLLAFKSISVLLFAYVMMPPLIFFQPVFVFNAHARRRFDMVVLRIFSILTAVCIVFFCFYAFDFALANPSEGLQIRNSLTLTPSLFGHDTPFTIAIDNFVIRILFCGCGAVTAVSSFLLRSKIKKKSLKKEIAR